MKLFFNCTLLLAATLLITVESALAREWTTRSGQSLEAEFVRMMGDKVYLKPKEGPQKAVPFNLLSASDQKKVRELSGGAAPRKLGERKFGEPPREKVDGPKKLEPTRPKVVPGSQADKANQAIAAWREKKAAEEEERRKKSEASKARFEQQKKERAKRSSKNRRR